MPDKFTISYTFYFRFIFVTWSALHRVNLLCFCYQFITLYYKISFNFILLHFLSSKFKMVWTQESHQNKVKFDRGQIFLGRTIVDDNDFHFDNLNGSLSSSESSNMYVVSQSYKYSGRWADWSVETCCYWSSVM